MEHLRQLQLSDDPFRSDPLEKFDVSLASQRDALARLDRGVRQGRGLLLLAGASGAGKTRVARQLFESLEEEVFEAAMLVVLRHRVDADWLLGRLARQLGVEAPESEREALIAQVYERLAIIHEDGRRAVLIIDGADALVDSETLHEVCSLVKLEYEDRRLMTVVLVGGESLDAAIASDPQLSHGIDVRVALRPLESEESQAYLQSRIAVAGGPAELLLPGSSAALHELAQGSPGRLNILADNALFEAAQAGRSEVTRADVECAWTGLGWDRVGAVPNGPAPVENRAPAAAVPIAEPQVGTPGLGAAPAEGASAMGTPLEGGDSMSGLLDADDPALLEDQGEMTSLLEDASPSLTPIEAQTALMDFDSAPQAAPVAAAPAPQLEVAPVEAARAPQLEVAPIELSPEPEPAAVEATVVAFAEADELDAPPKDESDLDDLFMELLDDE